MISPIGKVDLDCISHFYVSPLRSVNGQPIWYTLYNSIQENLFYSILIKTYNFIEIHLNSIFQIPMSIFTDDLII